MRKVQKQDGLFIGGATDTKEDYIKALTLSEDATWGDISRAQTEQYRLSQAREYHLPESASFSDILRAQAEQEHRL